MVEFFLLFAVEWTIKVFGVVFYSHILLEENSKDIYFDFCGSSCFSHNFVG